MKYAFVIDLNVMRFAATLKNEKGDQDNSSKQLLVSIIKLCNPLFIPCGYESVYIQLLSELRTRNEFVDSGIFSLWRLLWTTEGKLNYPKEQPSSLEEEGEFDADDTDFVRLLAKIDSGIVFATTDDRLRCRLNELGMTHKYGFNVLRPEHAIEYVGDKD